MTSGVATPGGGWRRADPPTTGLKGDQRGRRRGGRRGGARDGDPTVEDADFRSYYGRQIVKSPTWKTPDVPLYLFLGGAAGSASVLGAMAEVTDRPGLAKAAQYFASGGALASVGFLIHDLGRPARFLHMLRVVKVTSPLSVGSYILSPFSALTTATAGLRLLTLAPVAGAVARVVPFLPRLVAAHPGLRVGSAAAAAVFGGPMATYTAVLLANTAVPSWHEPHNQLPFVFAGSGMAAGGGICMALAPVAEGGPARKMAVVGAAVELGAMHKVEHDHGLVSEPYRIGRAGTLLKAAKGCTAAGAALTLAAGRTRAGSVAAGVLLAAGSALTRFGVFDAGMHSTRDPKYVVVPQRERLAKREADRAAGEARSVTR